MSAAEAASKSGTGRPRLYGFRHDCDNAAVPGRRSMTIALLLAAWAIGPAAALGMALHAAGDHHGHGRAAERLALATSHGHEHGSAVPAHDHDASRPAAPQVPAAAADATAEPSITARAAIDGWPILAGPPATGSPPRLFYSHCALLL
jgi:hypothetical protein